MTTALIKQTTITEICAHRRASLDAMTEALDLMKRGLDLAAVADKHAQHAHGAATFIHEDRSKHEAYQRIFADIDPNASFKSFRQQIDARIWMNLIALTGMTNMMDRTAKDELYAQLMKDVPEVTEDNIRSTFEGLARDSGLIFQRGLARAFIDLDRRFRSHDGFKIGSRIIIDYAFDAYGHWNYRNGKDATIVDIERVFAVLDGSKPDPRGLLDAIRSDRHGYSGPKQSCTEGEYFRIRGYKNGNAHLWFTRDDLVEKANLVLADYYGAVLPDGVPDDVTPDDILNKSTAICKNLSFYGTPDKVLDIILDDTHFDRQSLVLEPSAGTGNIVRAILARQAGTVHAVEVDYDRVTALRGISRVDRRLIVDHNNFLQMTPNPRYTHVIMNPPFYGVHYMHHVMHAHKFLAPGGVLIAVLPSSVEFGETKAHEAFRAWVDKHVDRYGRITAYRDLPPESFADSGTRVNTCYVVLHKGAS